MGLAATSELLELKILVAADADHPFFRVVSTRLARKVERFFTPHTRGENLVCARRREQISNVSARFTVKYRILSPAIRL